jgi:hypothetical protein
MLYFFTVFIQGGFHRFVLLYVKRKETFVFRFDYPPIKQSLGMAALRDPYPVLYLDARGFIRGANLLAYWLWERLRDGEPFSPETFLGVNAFNVRASNLHRIPVEQNREFFTKLSAIIKRMNALDRERAAHDDTFPKALRDNPQLAEIFETAPFYTEEEWEYPLTITHPDKPDQWLEFRVNIYRIEGGGEMLLTYIPYTSTVPFIEEQYARLLKAYPQTVYLAQVGPEEEEKLPVNFEQVYRDYYPMIVQDPLWYLVEENKAHQLMMGASVVGFHFFHLLFSPIVREYLGPLRDTSAPRAIRYFQTFTSPFLQENHELHAKYINLLAELDQLPDYKATRAMSEKMTMRLDSHIHLDPLRPEAQEPFYTCRVILPWRYEPDVRLQFKSMVRLKYEPGMVIQADKRYYQVTLVPENHDTDVALIFLPLFDDHGGPAETGETNDKQLRWLLTVLQTAQEGIMREGEDQDWRPEEAYQRIQEKLKNSSVSDPEQETLALALEIDRTILWLTGEGMVSESTLLALLSSFAVTQPHLEKLRQEIAARLERIQNQKLNLLD